MIPVMTRTHGKRMKGRGNVVQLNPVTNRLQKSGAINRVAVLKGFFKWEND